MAIFWDTGRHSSVFLKFYRFLMALLWYSSYWKLMPFNMGFLYNVSLGLRGTSDFSLLPLKACAVTIAQWLVLPFLLSHNFFLLVRPSWKSLTDFLFQDPLGLLILAIWPFSPFQLFGCPPSLSFFPNSWNLLLLSWKFPSRRFYLWFSHSWFLVVQLLCSWMFALYFLIPYCMSGCLRPVCHS